MSKDVANRYRQWCSRCLDFHSHFIHPQVFDHAEPFSVSTGFGASPLPRQSDTYRKLTDPALQIADMDARGIDASVISSADVIQSRAWAEPAEEAALTSMVNDMAMRWVADHPSRFIGSFVLPLGDMALALAEAKRCIDAGFGVVNLPSNHRGDYLGSPRFEPLWEALEAQGVVIFIHPDGVRDMWFQDYAMWNSIGQSIEEVRVMSSLIYTGTMDRYSKAKVVMAHGGGYMPHYMGRLDRNFTDKPMTAKNLSKKPSEYLGDFYYDSCVYDARTLEVLVERVGADRIVLGGDYPVAALDPIDFLETATGLTDEQRGWIAGGTAERLLARGASTA